MGALFDRYDVEPIRGKDITINTLLPEVFVSDLDIVFYYPGICLNDFGRRSMTSFVYPYYMSGKHSTDKNIAKEIKGFYRIIGGCVMLDRYMDDGAYSKCLFKKIDCGVRFPCTDNYYAVFVNQKEDAELTREIFGLTHQEITSLLEAYGKTMGTHPKHFSYPKLTKSSRNTNFCDLTDLWIPERFPYIAFTTNGCDFSHVSLWGFYRHIQLLTGYNANSVFSNALINAGVDQEILDKVFNMDIYNVYQEKITNRMFFN